MTGIHLDGNAALWWPHAEGRYERGNQPSIGAILVFKPSRTMHVGHVAVVSRIVGPREILVDQANWIPGRVSKAMSVVDASPQNDWTSVKVMEPHSGKHGRENATFGFIYQRAVATGLAEATAAPQPERHRKAETVRLARHDAIPATQPIGNDKTPTARLARHDKAAIVHVAERERAPAVHVAENDKPHVAHATEHGAPEKRRHAHREVAQADPAKHSAGSPAPKPARHPDTLTPPQGLAATVPPHRSLKPTDTRLAAVY